MLYYMSNYFIIKSIDPNGDILVLNNQLMNTLNNQDSPMELENISEIQIENNVIFDQQYFLLAPNTFNDIKFTGQENSMITVSSSEPWKGLIKIDYLNWLSGDIICDNITFDISTNMTSSSALSVDGGAMLQKGVLNTGGTFSESISIKNCSVIIGDISFNNSLSTSQYYPTFDITFGGLIGHKALQLAHNSNLTLENNNITFGNIEIFGVNDSPINLNFGGLLGSFNSLSQDTININSNSISFSNISVISNNDLISFPNINNNFGGLIGYYSCINGSPFISTDVTCKSNTVNFSDIICDSFSFINNDFGGLAGDNSLDNLSSSLFEDNTIVFGNIITKNYSYTLNYFGGIVGAYSLKNSSATIKNNNVSFSEIITQDASSSSFVITSFGGLIGAFSGSDSDQIIQNTFNIDTNIITMKKISIEDKINSYINITFGGITGAYSCDSLKDFSLTNTSVSIDNIYIATNNYIDIKFGGLIGAGSLSHNNNNNSNSDNPIVSINNSSVTIKNITLTVNKESYNSSWGFFAGSDSFANYSSYDSVDITNITTPHIVRENGILYNDTLTIGPFDGTNIDNSTLSYRDNFTPYPPLKKIKIQNITYRNVQTRPGQYYRLQPCLNPTPTQEIFKIDELCHLTRSANTNIKPDYNLSYKQYISGKKVSGNGCANDKAQDPSISRTSSSRIQRLKYNAIAGTGDKCPNCQVYLRDTRSKKESNTCSMIQFNRLRNKKHSCK